MAESSNGSKSGEQCSKPVCIITLGMAGSGKTTFVQVILLCNLINAFLSVYFFVKCGQCTNQ